MDTGVIRFGPEVCHNLESALRREWLETNGLGGFSSSTITGLNTRRYHGLLTAATKPPVGRMVLLSKLEECVIIGGERYDLSANRYPGVIHPQGHRCLKEFRLHPFPVFTFEVNGVEIEKRVFMVHGENTTVIEYDLRGPCTLELRPLIAFRDYHATTHRNSALNPAVEMTNGQAVMTPYESLPSLYLAHNAVSLELTGHWYDNFEYSAEQERGLDHREDLFNPFLARFTGPTATVIASTQPHDATLAPQLRAAEVERRARIVAAAPSREPVVRALTAAADQFLVQRGEGNTIIAGYHWFSDWGRDTMIALPGLTLATNRADVAKRVLLAFAQTLDRGMLPNRFPDSGETPEYNSVDATLWFFEAVRALLAHTRDAAFVREHLYEKLKSVINAHLCGTRYGIHVDSDGLLAAGVPGSQLTWMDSKIGDWVVTPRLGKPVEIQALWYNALRIMETLARAFGDTGPRRFLHELAGHAGASFHHLFWNHEAGCLYDVVNGGERDPSLRPNQVFAVSLPYTMLPPDRAARVVQVIERELLTPIGLRTLSPQDPRYRARYEGGVHERDSSYHQGTVWPWLMGPFLTAYVKVNSRSPVARAQAARWLNGFTEHLQTAGLGQVSEIADADPPHTSRGCIAQAWSVGELLRAAVDDVFPTRTARKLATKV